MSAKHSIGECVILEEDELLSDFSESESSLAENDVTQLDTDASQGYIKAK